MLNATCIICGQTWRSASNGICDKHLLGSDLGENKINFNDEQKDFLSSQEIAEAYIKHYYSPDLLERAANLNIVIKPPQNENRIPKISKR